MLHPWEHWRWQSKLCSSSREGLGRRDDRGTRCCDPRRCQRRTWPSPNRDFQTFSDDRIWSTRDWCWIESWVRESCVRNWMANLSASSPSNVITAESARVMAGAAKNSPTITNNNNRKNVFCMSWKKTKQKRIVEIKISLLNNYFIAIIGNTLKHWKPTGLN